MAASRGRIQFIEHLRHAKVPILKMRDSITGIDFDISQGGSFVNNRHIEIVKKASCIYDGL